MLTNKVEENSVSGEASLPGLPEKEGKKEAKR